jgi:O-antigen/teichoic acid export membrane protein
MRRPESIRRSTAFALAMRLVGALFTSALTLFLVRYLGPDDYGLYALAVSLGGLVLLPVDFGVSRSAARFIAEHRGNAAAVAGVLRSAIGLKIIGTGIGGLLLLVLAGPISSAYGADSLAWPLRVVSLALVGQSFMLLFTTAFEALGRNALGFNIALSESALETVASIALVLAGAGVTGAIAGRAIGYIVAAALAAVIATRLLGRRNLAGSPWSGIDLRRIARFAGALFLIDAAFTAFGYVDILLIAAFLDPRAAGLFSAPMQVLIFAQYGGLALAAGIGPRLSSGSRGAAEVASFQSGLRLLIAVQFLIVAPVVVWATPITDLLFGAGYEQSADVLRGLAPYAVMLGPVPMLALSINYLGEARRRVPVAVGAVAINALIDAILIPRIGIVAGAIGTDVAFLFFTAGHLMIARSLIDLPLLLLGRTLLRATVAAAAMSAVLLGFGTESLTAAEAIGGSILGLLAYGVALVVTRELGPSELHAAWGAVRRPFGRPAP